VRSDLELERRAKEEALNSKTSIQEKSTAFIQEQQRQIEKLHKDKVLYSHCCNVCHCGVQESSEKQVGELTRQLSSLKHQLDNTAETQKDFVELSQNLQVRHTSSRPPTPSLPSHLTPSHTLSPHVPSHLTHLTHLHTLTHLTRPHTLTPSQMRLVEMEENQKLEEPSQS